MPDSETTTGAGKKIIADAKVGFAPKAGQVNTPEPGPVGGTAKKIFIGAVVIVAAGKGFLTRWLLPQPKALGPGFTSGNGRIKRTEINVAPKIAGRLSQLLVKGGRFRQSQADRRGDGHRDAGGPVRTDCRRRASYLAQNASRSRRAPHAGAIASCVPDQTIQ